MSSCPKGLQNDPYPGSCRLYTDQNADGFCDLSQDTVPPASTSLNFLLLFCLIVPILAYLFTSKFKLFWNIGLLLSFIITATTSLLYIFQIVNHSIFQLHLYFGTIMLSISFCHLFWHWRYFFALTRVKK